MRHLVGLGSHAKELIVIWKHWKQQTGIMIDGPVCVYTFMNYAMIKAQTASWLVPCFLFMFAFFLSKYFKLLFTSRVLPLP